MKLKKKSGLMGAVIALSAASLVSVGFASWVISQGDTQHVAGTINVDNVDNNAHFISFTSGGSYNSASKTYTLTNNVVFGKAAEDATTNAKPWLTNDGKLGGTGAEGSSVSNLVFEIGLSVTNVWSNAEATGDVAVSSILSVDEFETTDAAKWGVKRNDKYLVAQEPTFTFGTNFVRAADNTTGTTTLTVTFAYGEYFGTSGNPYTYFNNTYANADVVVSEGVTAAQEAQAVLEALNAINGLGFTFDIIAAA